MPKGKQWLWIVGVMSAAFVVLAIVGAVLPESEDEPAVNAASATKPRPPNTPTSTASPSGCDPDDAKKVLDTVLPPATVFSDAFDRAIAASRLTLSEPISEMQEARRDVVDADMPSCGNTVRFAMRDAYQSAIDGFLAFQVDNSTAAAAALERAGVQLREVAAMLDDLTTDAY